MSVTAGMRAGGSGLSEMQRVKGRAQNCCGQMRKKDITTECQHCFMKSFIHLLYPDQSGSEYRAYTVGEKTGHEVEILFCLFGF